MTSPNESNNNPNIGCMAAFVIVCIVGLLIFSATVGFMRRTDRRFTCQNAGFQGFVTYLAIEYCIDTERGIIFPFESIEYVAP